MRWRNALIAVVFFCLTTSQAFSQIGENDPSVVGGDFVQYHALAIGSPMQMDEILNMFVDLSFLDPLYTGFTISFGNAKRGVFTDFKSDSWGCKLKRYRNSAVCTLQVFLDPESDLWLTKLPMVSTQAHISPSFSRRLVHSDIARLERAIAWWIFQRGG
jgi:hypothetical protein